MALLTRSPDDLLIDAIKTSIETYRNEQVALDQNVGFRVVRDMIEPPFQSMMPLVNIWSPSCDPVTQSSSRPVELETISINVDCYTKGLTPDSDNLDCTPIAMQRLYYLKNQVKMALYRMIAADFGYSPGVIARKKWPRWQMFQNDLKLPESEVVAGRWSFEVEINWEADDIDGATLTDISIDAGIFGAAYQLGGD